MSLRGKLGYRDIADLLNMVDSSKKSGVLSVTHEQDRARLFFEWGDLIRAESTKFTDRIGELLVLEGVVAPDVIGLALKKQSAEGGARRLGAILHEEFKVTAEQMQDALMRQSKAVVFDLLTWPGGEFIFDTAPAVSEEEREQFNFGAADFILEVGVEAGFLVREGERTVTELSVAVLDSDEHFATRLGHFFIDQGAMAKTASTLGKAAEALDSGQFNSVVVNIDNGEFEALAKRAADKGIIVVGYGEDVDEDALPEASPIRALTYKPPEQDLVGELGQERFVILGQTIVGALSRESVGKSLPGWMTK